MNRSLAVYRPLSGEKHIRLIEFEPGETGTEIRCRLIERNLNDDFPYAALSYTLGKRDVIPYKALTPRQVVWCNGEPLPITENLYEALSTIRGFRIGVGSTTLLLWVDVICINQGNLEEYKRQLLIMSHIYAKASFIITWVRSEDNSARLLFQVENQTLVMEDKMPVKDTLAEHGQLVTLENLLRSVSSVSGDQTACLVYLDKLRELAPEASELLAFMSILGARAISAHWLPPLDGLGDTLRAIQIIVASGFAMPSTGDGSVFLMRSSIQVLTIKWLKSRNLFEITLLAALRHVFTMSRYLYRYDREEIHASLSHAELWAKRVPTAIVKGKFRMHAFCMLLLNTDQILSARSSLSKARRRAERSYRYLVHYSPQIDPRRFSDEILLALYHHHVGRKTPLPIMNHIATGAINSVFSSYNLPLLPFPDSIGLIRLILNFFSSLNTRRSGLSRPTRIREHDQMSITIPIESIFSGTRLTGNMMDDFVNCFTNTLINDGLILSLLTTITARQTMPRSKIQNNLRKLLNHLAKDLQRESSARGIRALEEFIASHSPYISTSIVGIVDGVKKNLRFTVHVFE